MTKPNVRIIVGKDDSIEKTIRKFKKLCEKQGIRKECRSRRYFEKPSEVRRKNERKAARNRRKNAMEGNDNKKFKRANQRNWIFTHPKLTIPNS